MFAVDQKKKKAARGVTFEEDLAPGADASLQDKALFVLKKSPFVFLLDPTKRLLCYNASVMGLAVLAIVQWGEALAI